MAHHKEKYNQEFVNKVHEMNSKHDSGFNFTKEEIGKQLNINSKAVYYILKNRPYIEPSPKDEILENFHEKETEESMAMKIKKLLNFWKK
tara:strand:- start:865 stop:1134 length:270 start_codon:yes stop_codon:yes gene_type:complete